MAEDEVAADALNAFEVDEDELGPGFEGFVKGGKAGPREFEVMIDIADEGEVDAGFRQFDAFFRAKDGDDVGGLGFVGSGTDVVEEILGDLDREDFALGSDGGSHGQGEQTGAGANIGGGHAGFEVEGFQDGFAVVEDLTAFGFEALGPFFDFELGIEKLLVDAGFDAGVLTEKGGGGNDEEGKNAAVHEGVRFQGLGFLSRREKRRW